MLTHKEIWYHHDPRWADVSIPLQIFLAEAGRSFDDVFSWAAEQGWHEHFARNAVAWLESRGLAAWSWVTRTWRGRPLREQQRAAAAASPPAAPAPRPRPVLHHRTCHACQRSFFSAHPGARLCTPCRPDSGCALCGEPLPPDPAWLGSQLFCCPKHRTRSKPSGTRPHERHCIECGAAFWTGNHGRLYCCSLHRKRAAARRAATPPPAERLTPARLLVARAAIANGATVTAVAARLGVHRHTLRRRLDRLPG